MRALTNARHGKASAWLKQELPLLPRMALGVLTVFACLLGNGCSSKTAESAAPEPETREAANTHTTAPGTLGVPTQAQPKLSTMKLFLGTHEIVAELARTETQWQTGMMFRQEIGEMEGMLFVFPFPHRASFYMKNTQVPLSCAYIDPEGIIVEVHELKPFDEKPVPASTDRIQYVLETSQGWFARHQISVGAVIRSERGSLAETFFSRR